MAVDAARPADGADVRLTGGDPADDADQRQRDEHPEERGRAHLGSGSSDERIALIAILQRVFRCCFGASYTTSTRSRLPLATNTTLGLSGSANGLD